MHYMAQGTSNPFSAPLQVVIAYLTMGLPSPFVPGSALFLQIWSLLAPKYQQDNQE